MWTAFELRDVAQLLFGDLRFSADGRVDVNSKRTPDHQRDLELREFFQARDVLRSVNGTASECKTFLATATKECCPARGTLAGHFTRRLSPSPMPGKRIQQQRAYLPLKRSSPRPQFYRIRSRSADRL